MAHSVGNEETKDQESWCEDLNVFEFLTKTLTILVGVQIVRCRRLISTNISSNASLQISAGIFIFSGLNHFDFEV